MNASKVSASDVRLYTEAVASCRHPEKGRILFAARAIEKGEVLAVEPRSSIVSRSFEAESYEFTKIWDLRSFSMIVCSPE